MIALVWGVLGICAACLWPTDAPPTDLPELSIDPQALLDTGLVPDGDNYTWQNHPDHNHGTRAELRTGSNSVSRAFVRWDHQTIVSVLGQGTLVSARLDVTLVGTSSWGPNGGGLGVYRVTQDWTELGGTANCAIDTDLSNEQPDCSGATAWVLNNPGVAPWVAAFTDTVTLTNGQTGTVSFDVTADVQAFLGGTANYGWVVKPHNDGAAVDVRFYSREGATPPILVLTVNADTSRPPLPDNPGLPPGSTALLVANPEYPSEVVYYRNIVGVIFDDSTSGPTIYQILARHGATIIGGAVDTYVLRVADPGLTLASLDSVRSAIASEVGVAYVTRIEHRDRRAPRGGRPGEVPGNRRPGQARWPVLHDALPNLDTTRLLDAGTGRDTVLIYRTDISLSFKPGMSDSAKAAFFARHSLTVIGVTPSGSTYFVRMPDPGDLQTYRDSTAALRREPDVEGVGPLFRSELVPISDARFLTDGTGQTPSNWLMGSFPKFDTTMIVQVQADSDTVAYFRTDVQMRFRPAVSDSAKQAFFAAHALTVTGVTDDAKFFVRMPDPGPTLEDFYDAIDNLSAAPEVWLLVPIFRTPLRTVKEAPRAVFDPGGQARSDWRDPRLTPVADMFTWQRDPNRNNGSATVLRTGSGNVGRAFARWDQPAIASALGQGALVSARLDLTLVGTSGWGPNGGVLGVYRVTRDWTELRSTANCAIDTDLSNEQPDCSGATAWVLNNPGVAPWVPAPTDTVTVTNGQTGSVSFDVTGDVQAFLSDTANYGWVVKPHNDGAVADVRLSSREGASPPLLLVTVDADTARPPVPDGFAAPDSTEALLTTVPTDTAVLVLRNIITLEFWDTTTGPRVQQVLNAYSAEVVGGYPLAGAYIVKVPDPGSYEALDSLLRVIRSESGVRSAFTFIYREPVRELSRFPVDGSTAQRQDWTSGSGTDATRALRAIRAPLACGCETGSYGGDPTALPAGVTTASGWCSRSRWRIGVP